MIRLILTSLLLTLSVYAAAQQKEKEIKHRPSTASYTAQGIGISFPAFAGAFKKTEVLQSFNQAIGTVVRYSSESGSCADIYIYQLGFNNEPLTQTRADEHFKDLERIIHEMPQKKKYISDIQFEFSRFLDIKPLKVHRTRFSFKIAGDRRISELIVFPYKNHIVKVRISSASVMQEKMIVEEFDRFFQRICEAFQ